MRTATLELNLSEIEEEILLLTKDNLIVWNFLKYYIELIMIIQKTNL